MHVEAIELKRKYPGRFIHLHLHSEGSLLDGANKIKTIASIVKEGAAITDHGNMFEVINFYKEMRKQGKKPILGFECYIENILDVKNGTNNKVNHRKVHYHLVLLAKTFKGLLNLYALSTRASDNMVPALRGGNHKPVVKHEDLKKYSEDIICMSACLGGEVSQYLLHDDYKNAKEIVSEFKDIFGEDFYLEVQIHEITGEKKVNEGIVNLAKILEIQVVATNDPHYPTIKDKEMHQLVLAINSNKTMSDPKLFKFQGVNYHILESNEAEEIYVNHPDALDNTIEIFNKCNVEIPFPETIEDYHMPVFEIPEDFKASHSSLLAQNSDTDIADLLMQYGLGAIEISKDSSDAMLVSDASVISDKELENRYLRYLCWSGFKERYYGTPLYDSELYRARLKFELDIIIQMKYPAYFLIVQDFINWAKDRGILVGPGRGSAAGSVVAYALKITDLDPIKYALLFERFLNPERVSMPDIDIDFQDTRREEVIEYVKAKYGEDAVAQIITFGTLGAKAAVRRVAKSYDYSYAIGDKLSKAIPAVPGMTIKKALEESPEFAKMYNDKENPHFKIIIDYAMGIEGLKCNMSKHAAGVVIADKAIENYIPKIKVLDKDSGKWNWVTQFTMTTVEELGLLKMDFLGLKTLGVIADALVLINAKRKKQGLEPLLFEDIPIDDVEMYKSIMAKGDTDMVFQLESGGMKSFMKQLYSDFASFKEGDGDELFERLIAGISLYRPGPMESIPEYIHNMSNSEAIVYLDPKLEPILKTTYGKLVYQEQVMQIVQELGGYTLGQADIIRRAMGKKKMDVMAEHEKIFAYGEAICPECHGEKRVDGEKCSFCDGKGSVNGQKLFENETIVCPKCRGIKNDHKSECKVCKDTKSITIAKTNSPLYKDVTYTIAGAVKDDIPVDVCIEIFADMIEFAKYAFNKSHAAAYGVLSAKTGYLKHHYLTEFLIANLNNNINNSDKLKYYLHVCKKANMTILPPDVNKSGQLFIEEDGSIRFGLRGIKNLGAASVIIEDERDSNGQFADYQDFVERMAIKKTMDRKILLAVIYSGALDGFDGTRRAKLLVLDNMLKNGTTKRKDSISGQMSLFSMEFCSEIEELQQMNKIEVPVIEEFHKQEKLKMEKEYAGLYVTEHPLDEYNNVLKYENIDYISSFTMESEEESDGTEDIEDNLEELQGKKVRVAGMITSVEYKIVGPKNDTMMIYEIEDVTGTMKGTVYGDKANMYRDKIIENSIVIVDGKLKVNDFGVQINTHTMINLKDKLRIQDPTDILLKVAQQEQLDKFYEVATIYPGDCDVFAQIARKKSKMPFTVDISSSVVVNHIQDIFGSGYELHYGEPIKIYNIIDPVIEMLSPEESVALSKYIGSLRKKEKKVISSILLKLQKEDCCLYAVDDYSEITASTYLDIIKDITFRLKTEEMSILEELLDNMSQESLSILHKITRMTSDHYIF